MLALGDLRLERGVSIPPSGFSLPKPSRCSIAARFLRPFQSLPRDSLFPNGGRRDLPLRFLARFNPSLGILSSQTDRIDDRGHPVGKVSIPPSGFSLPKRGQSTGEGHSSRRFQSLPRDSLFPNAVAGLSCVVPAGMVVSIPPSGFSLPKRPSRSPRGPRRPRGFNPSLGILSSQTRACRWSSWRTPGGFNPSLGILSSQTRAQRGNQPPSGGFQSLPRDSLFPNRGRRRQRQVAV